MTLARALPDAFVRTASHATVTVSPRNAVTSTVVSTTPFPLTGSVCVGPKMEELPTTRRRNCPAAPPVHAFHTRYAIWLPSTDIRPSHRVLNDAPSVPGQVSKSESSGHIGIAVSGKRQPP